MKRKQLKKQLNAEYPQMTQANIRICIDNQQGFQTVHLNNSLHLHYYGFRKIQNLSDCLNPKLLPQSSESLSDIESQGVNTIYLNNNILQKIQNLSSLKQCLITLNLSHNQIQSLSGLQELSCLRILDISHNKIQKIQREHMKGLQSLQQLNLSSNCIKSQWKQSMIGLIEMKDKLQVLNMSENQIEPLVDNQKNQDFLKQFWSKFTCIKILSFKNTPYARKTPSYRKQLIYAIESLTNLDDRPVTNDQRFMIKAWKQGGLKQEKQARKQLCQSKEEKNRKIYEEIEERNKIIEQKVQKIYDLKSKNQQEQLQKLVKQKQAQQIYDLLDQEQKTVLNLNIEDLQTYLALFKEQCRYLDLDKELGLKTEEIPKMIMDSRTEECIYIYNVEESQLEKIRQKFYPNETLPLKIINHERPKEPRWLNPDYDQILEHLYKANKSQWNLIKPMFNLQVYQFDLNARRKLKRFEIQQLQKYVSPESIKREISDPSNEQTNFRDQKLVQNSLDCLD